MKRFFCIICNKVKRVRNAPKRMKAPEKISYGVLKSRTGVCNRHPN